MTLKEIAELAGVSPSTVSNALNDRGNVSARQKQRILELCHQYGLDIKERKYSKKDTNTILFNFSDFDRKFYLEIIHGISDYVYSHHFDLIISTTGSCEKFMDSRYTSGAIILDRNCRDSLLLDKAREGYRIVTMDRIFTTPNIKSVVVDNYRAMRELMTGLVARGYRRFAFLAGPDTLDNQERYKAFSDVLDEHGISFSRNRYYLGDFKEKSGYQAARLMLMTEDLPEILVCVNDNMAIGAMKMFRQMGKRIPEDIAITGFDGTEESREYGITTIEIPNYERGYLAAQCLVQDLIGNSNNDIFKIAVNVIWRGSTRSATKQQ